MRLVQGHAQVDPIAGELDDFRPHARASDAEGVRAPFHAGLESGIDCADGPHRRDVPVADERDTRSQDFGDIGGRVDRVWSRWGGRQGRELKKSGGRLCHRSRTGSCGAAAIPRAPLAALVTLMNLPVGEHH